MTNLRPVPGAPGAPGDWTACGPVPLTTNAEDDQTNARGDSAFTPGCYARVGR